MKSRRKIWGAILGSILLLGVVFFITFGEDMYQVENEKENSVEKKKVVFLTKSTTSNFWKSAYAGANAASTEYNLELLCEGPETEEDYEAQNKMIEKAIEDQVDAIVFSAVDFEANAEKITKASEKGIKIIVVDSEVNSNKVSCYIGTDNYEAGCTAGEEVLKNQNPILNIGIVNFDKNSENGQTREQGFRETVEKDKRTKIIQSVNVRSTVEDAKASTIQMLRENPEINVIVTFNEWTSLGVGYAVKELNLKDTVQVIAFDSNVISVEMLESGEVDALIVQNPYAMGYLGIENAYALINNQQLKEKKVETSSILVTKDNMYNEESQRALFLFDKNE